MRVVEIGDVIKIISGAPFKSELFNENGEGLPLIRVRDVNTKPAGIYYSGTYSPEFLIDSGDLLVSMDGDFKCVSWSYGKGLLNQRVCKIVPDESVISRSYLRFFLPKALSDIHRDTTYTTVKHLSTKSINTIKIPLPPLDDQIRIAHLLSKVEELISQRKQHLKQLDELLKSVFLEMFGDIKARKSNHPWEKLRPYLNASSGKSSKQVLSEIETAFPIYGGNGINGWATIPLYEEPVVIAGRVGQQCGIIHVSTKACWVTDNAIVIRIKNKTKLNAVYLSTALQYAPIREKVKQLDLPFINQPMILDFPLPLPPIGLQNEFAAVVEKIEGIKARYQASLAELERLYGVLSQQAFKGELDLSRVTLPASTTPLPCYPKQHTLAGMTS